MWLPLSILLLSLLVGSSTSSPDESLPVYLREINWNKVQEYLKEDLRLPDSVFPSNYAIELSVNVRGHAGAQKSDFNGTVTIYLNISKPIDKIELHSNGLVIEKASLIERVIFAKSAGVSRISSNLDRETITIHVNRTIQPNEEFMLQITYRGVAKMDEYGLYENWDPKLNKSLDSNGPFVLASRNFPAGARFWFPCFDEPDKRATFEFHINHPRGLNVYSNTEIERTENEGESRTLTVFKITRSLSTYQTALSVNHYVSQSLDVKGFTKVRLINSTNSHAYRTSLPDPNNIQKCDPDIPIIPALLRENLELLHSIEGSSKDKLDIIILEGAYSMSVQPGLITIGRYNFWRHMNKRIASQDLRHLAQVRVGNLISARSVNEIWMNSMFTTGLPNDTYAKFNYGFTMPREMLLSSLHERPLRDSIVHATSTKQYLASKNELPAMKASNLLRLLNRFCTTSIEISKKYIADHMERFADIDDFIDTASKYCHDPATAREFLQDFINQPGKTLLSVKRSNGSVIIRQTRYHNTYFDVKLRDNRTRYTLPIFFAIDGKEDVKVFRKNETSLKIPVPLTSLFLIDHEYDNLYFVYYEDSIVPPRNITDHQRALALLALRKSMIAAVSIGFVNYTEILNQQEKYDKEGIYNEMDLVHVRSSTQFFLQGCERKYNFKEQYGDDSLFQILNGNTCQYWQGHPTTWDGLFNNDTKYWEDILYTSHTFVQHMHCISYANNSALYRSFLADNFLGENTIIRPVQMANIAQRNTGGDQWIDLHRFFFRNAANYTNHRFDLLADTVLNQLTVEPFLAGNYPTVHMREDYLKELRDFVIRNPRRAASMSTEIEMRLEREYVREYLPKWHNGN